jgi:hypothetical protein
LPLTAAYLAAVGSQLGGTIQRPSHPYFRIDTALDCAVQFLFAFGVSPSGAVSPLPQELAAALDFADRVGGGGDIVVLVLVELALCQPRADFDPGGAVEMARYYPLTTVWANVPFDEVRTTTTVTRPSVSPMRDMPEMSPAGAILGALYADMNGSINLWPDGWPGDASFPPSPRWDTMFAHYLLPPGAAGKSFEVVGRQPGRIDTGNNRRSYDRATSGYAATPAVEKVARQGAFDNIHVAPSMLFSGSGLTLPNAFMAPICQHDCLHTHWRWGDSFGEPRNCGWGNGGPYTVPGAPMVPLNQTVDLSVSAGGNGFTYRTTSRSAPVGVPQMAFHHGGAFATGKPSTVLTWALSELEAAQLVSDKYIDVARPLFAPSWASFYFHNRWIWSAGTHGYVSRLDESNFGPLEAL